MSIYLRSFYTDIKSTAFSFKTTLANNKKKCYYFGFNSSFTRQASE